MNLVDKELDFRTRFVAAQLYVILDESDNFEKKNKQDLEKYTRLTRKLLPALEEFISLLESNTEMSEDRFQYETFEISKRHFDKEEISFFFSSIYALLFKQRSGPKLSSMIFMMGKDRAADILRKRIQGLNFI